jgi:uncharacterized membrane protein SpoIIM required for sporulation
LKLDRFVADRSGEWAELDQLVDRAGVNGARLSPEELMRLGTLYRSAASDLAVARRYFPASTGELRLRGLVARAYAIVYARPGREETVRGFFASTLWRRIRENIAMVALAVAIMAAGVIFGAIWALNEPATAATLLPGHVVVTSHNHGGFYGVSVAARGGLATEIFVNNILVSIFAMLGGFTAGILTAYLLAYNGAVLGVLGALEWRVGGLGDFTRLVVPHGLLELSCIALAGGAGFIVARALIDPGPDTRADALGRVRPVVGAFCVGFMAFLVAAGLTEGFITPWDLPTAGAVAVGLALAGTFWTLVFVRGRAQSRARDLSTR